MICQPCRAGGALNLGAFRVTDEESARWLQLRALENHGECDSRCDCQHVVGLVAQAEREPR